MEDDLKWQTMEDDLKIVEVFSVMLGFYPPPFIIVQCTLLQVVFLLLRVLRPPGLLAYTIL